MAALHTKISISGGIEHFEINPLICNNSQFGFGSQEFVSQFFPFFLPKWSQNATNNAIWAQFGAQNVTFVDNFPNKSKCPQTMQQTQFAIDGVKLFVILVAQQVCKHA